MTKDVPVAQMESLLLARITVGDSDIEQLATRRAMAIKDYLLAQHLGADRIFIGTANTRAADGATADAAAPSSTPTSSTVTPPSAPWTPHAALELGAR
jgi:hypothetical protein